MSRHTKTQAMLDAAVEALTENNPMTVRQVYYQLVSRQVIENCRTAYQAVSNLLVDARKDAVIPWEWIEDRLRQPRTVSMWTDLAEFAQTVQQAYRKDVWPTQTSVIECWLEKDALSGIFEDALSPYGVTLNVGRGYDGWDSIHNAADRFGNGEDVAVLYFGDFDPSGLDMVRSLRDRLGELGSRPEIVKCALTAEDVDRYHLPPAMTKTTDTRRAAFIAEYGDRCVELDALPVAVLRERIVAEVESRMDLDALAAIRQQEDGERKQLVELLSGQNGNTP